MLFEEKEKIVSIVSKEKRGNQNIFMICDKVVSLSNKTGETEKTVIRLGKTIAKTLDIGFEESLKMMLNWYFDKKMVIEVTTNLNGTSKYNTIKRLKNFKELLDNEVSKRSQK